MMSQNLPGRVSTDFAFKVIDLVKLSGLLSIAEVLFSWTKETLLKDDVILVVFGGKPDFLAEILLGVEACWRCWGWWGWCEAGTTTSTRGFESESSRDMDMALPAFTDRNISLPGVLERDESWLAPARDGVRVPTPVGPVAIDDGVIVGIKSVRRLWAEVESPPWKDWDMRSWSSPDSRIWERKKEEENELLSAAVRVEL